MSERPCGRFPSPVQKKTLPLPYPVCDCNDGAIMLTPYERAFSYAFVMFAS